MTGRRCSIEGCDTKHYGSGLCNKHYSRLRRYGNVDVTHRIIGDTEARFWEKVKKTEGCWEWTGAKNAAGYGLFHNPEASHKRAHTYSLELASGETYQPGMDTCHTCDNPSCVNPAHLYFGTRTQNIADSWARGRQPIGSERHSAKVTELDVAALRTEYAEGAEVSELVNAYGLRDSTIRNIVLGNIWKHAGGPITRRRKSTRKKAA